MLTNPISGKVTVLCLVILLLSVVKTRADNGTWDASGLYNSSLPAAGERIFLEPLVVKDADIDNQITPVPQYSGGRHVSSFFDLPLTVEKRLTPRLSLQIGTQYEALFARDFETDGFTSVEAQAKYLLYLSDKREIMTSLIARALAPTQTSKVGVGNPLTMTYYLVLNKGLGDLPIGWLRAFAFQSDAAFINPIGDGASPLAAYQGLGEFGDTLKFDFELEYNLPYLNHVLEIPLPRFVARLSPAVECRVLTNMAKTGGHQGLTAGFLSYEMNYQSSWYQVSAAYQRPFGADAPFRGGGVVLFATYFYDNLLSKLGFDPTPW